MRIVALLFVAACSSGPVEIATDASVNDADVAPADDASADVYAETDATDASSDASDGCFVSSVGTFGECMTTTACAALGDRVSTPGYCPGPASIECCTSAPNVADNPPVPSGWKLMQQSAVTSAMTTWAVAILDDPTTYPMFSTTTQMFGSLDVLARVEWHPPDFQNGAIHRGVTLYEPA